MDDAYHISGIEYHYREGWRFKKNYYEKDRFIPLTQEHITLATNKHGFRDGEHRIKKDVNSVRIMFVGDSYTAGAYISDEDIFTTLFRKKLESIKPSQIYDIMNSSVAAWGADQKYLYLKYEGVKYSPDYVFLMLAPNDIRESYIKKYVYLDDGNQLIEKKNRQLPLNEQFLWMFSNHFACFQFVQKKLNTDYGDFEHIVRSFPINFDGDDTSLYERDPGRDVRNAYVLFQRIIDSVIVQCKNNNISLIVVALPAKKEFTGQLNSTYYQPEKVSQFIRRIAEERDVVCVDLHAAFAQEADPLRLFIKNEYHYSKEGHQFIADRLINYITTHSERV